MFLQIPIQNFHKSSFKCKTGDFTNAPQTLRIALLLFYVQVRRFHRCILIFKLEGFINTFSYSSLNMLHLCFLIFKLEGFIDAFSYLSSKVLSSSSNNNKKNLPCFFFKQVWRLYASSMKMRPYSSKKCWCKKKKEKNSTSSPICCSPKTKTMTQLCLCLFKMTSMVQLCLLSKMMTI